MKKNYDGYVKDAYIKVNKIFIGCSILIFIITVILSIIFVFEQDGFFQNVEDVIGFIMATISYFLYLEIVPFIIYLLVRFVIKRNIRDIEAEVMDDNGLTYFRDCLDLPIAVSGLLYDYKISDSHMAAILIDLEHKGFIDCSKDCIKVINDSDHTLSRSEQIVLQLLLSFKNYDVFRNTLRTKLLYEVTYSLGYLKEIKGIPKTCVISCLVFGFTLLLNHYFEIDSDSSSLYYIVNRVSFLFSVVSLILYEYRKKVPFVKSKKGTDSYYKLMALKNYINDFGSLDDLPVEALNYRGEFYLYSVMFGYNEKVVSEYIGKLKNTFK